MVFRWLSVSPFVPIGFDKCSFGYMDPEYMKSIIFILENLIYADKGSNKCTLRRLIMIFLLF